MIMELKSLVLRQKVEKSQRVFPARLQGRKRAERWQLNYRKYSDGNFKSCPSPDFSLIGPKQGTFSSLTFNFFLAKCKSVVCLLFTLLSFSGVNKVDFLFLYVFQ